MSGIARYLRMHTWVWPFAAALIGTIAIGAIADIADGGRTALAESAHITEIIGLALLWMIAGSPGWTRWTDWAERRRHVHG